MKTYLTYLLPATVFYTICTILYGLLTLSGLTRPIDQWWGRLGWLGSTLEVFGYLALTIGVAWLAQVQRWRYTMRWIVQMGSRRGLRIGYIPVLDLALLVGALMVMLFVAQYAPALMSSALYMLGPIAFALSVALVTSTPGALDDVIETPIATSDYATKHRINEQALVEENSLDPLAHTQFIFGQKIKLPPS